MRGVLNLQEGTNSEAISQHKRSRDDTTPNGGISSSVSNSNNVPSSSLKKSNENSSCKGSSSISTAVKVNKFSTSLTAQKSSSSKKSKTANKSTVTKIQQTLKPLSQHIQAKSRQVSNIHQLYQQNKGGVQSHEVVMPLATPSSQLLG